jgi:hypothetical protein
MVQSIVNSSGAPPAVAASGVRAGTAAQDEAGLALERLVWAQMITHAGLDRALTSGGGEAAAPFARLFVEALAADLADSHPLGLTTNLSGPTGNRLA